MPPATLLRQRQCRGEADQLGAPRLDPLDRTGRRQPAGEDDMGDMMLRAHVDQLGKLRVHGDEVDPERPLRACLRPGDFGVEQLRRHRAAGDHPEAAGIADRGDEIALGNPGHRPAQDRPLATEECSAPRHQRLGPVVHAFSIADRCSRPPNKRERRRLPIPALPRPHPKPRSA
jgi:hypothetical protein